MIPSSGREMAETPKQQVMNPVPDTAGNRPAAGATPFGLPAINRSIAKLRTALK
jgi:hypothetical protein